MSVQVIPSNPKWFRPTASGSKYSGSNGPGVNVTVTAAPAAPVKASQANPVVINKILRMLRPFPTVPGTV